MPASYYITDIAESKRCDKNVRQKKEQRMYLRCRILLFHHHLELAIDKAKMIAKAEMDDIIKGEMNKKIKIFVSELGNTQNKTIVNDVESALVNHIKETPVRI